MRNHKISIIVLLFLPVCSWAQINLRFGGSTAESRLSDVNPDGKQNFFLSGSNVNVDFIFFMGRLGIGARYSKMDNIHDTASAQVNSSTNVSTSATNNSQGTPSLNLSSAKILNTGLLGLLSYRFYESDSESELQFEKQKAWKIPLKSFAEIVLAGGKSSQFQMITKDDVGLERTYDASNVDNYSASLLGGYQISVFQLSAEVGYREVHIHDAQTAGALVAREDAYKIAYPFYGIAFGFGF